MSSAVDRALKAQCDAYVLLCKVREEHRKQTAVCAERWGRILELETTCTAQQNTIAQQRMRILKLESDLAFAIGISEGAERGEKQLQATIFNLTAQRDQLVTQLATPWWRKAWGWVVKKWNWICEMSEGDGR